MLHFMNNHLELFFSKFEGNLIEAVMQMMVRGMAGPTYEVQADCCTGINNLNEWVLEKLNQNSIKHRELIQHVQEFCTKNGGQIFQAFLKEAMMIVCFEDCRNAWIFQKVLFSTMVIVN